MKNIFKIMGSSVLLLLMAFSFGFSQDFGSVTSAMKSGNSKEIAKYMDMNVEMTILNKEATYSKTQAEVVLRDFFSSNAPKTYKKVHSGTSGAGAKYEIGELATSTGTYRTYVFIKQKGASWLIQEIRIEKG